MREQRDKNAEAEAPEALKETEAEAASAEKQDQEEKEPVEEGLKSGEVKPAAIPEAEKESSEERHVAVDGQPESQSEAKDDDLDSAIKWSDFEEQPLVRSDHKVEESAKTDDIGSDEGSLHI